MNTEDIPTRLYSRDPASQCNTFLNAEDIVFDLATIRDLIDTNPSSARAVCTQLGMRYMGMTQKDPVPYEPILPPSESNDSKPTEAGPASN